VGPPPPLPPPPGSVTFALEIEAVVLAVVVIGEGVVEAETKLKEDAANRAAVDAKSMLSMFPVAVLIFLVQIPAAVFLLEANIKAKVGRRRMPVAVVDKERHDVVDDWEDDGACRCPCTLVVVVAAAKEEPAVVEEVDTEVEVILLLFRARHDDDKRAERVAVHAAQCAMLLKVFEMIKANRTN